VPARPIHDAAARGFECAVDRYVSGRPGYPGDAVAYLVRELGIGPGRDVLEIGAGTGKFTALIVPTGARITAVEPVAAMRSTLERSCPTIAVLDGTAEQLPIGDASADAVVVAQAFHWFDGDRALEEIVRVLRPDGRLGLIWNVRDTTSDWSERLTRIFDRLAGPTAPRYAHGRWRAAFERSSSFGPLHHQVAYHVHEVTRAAFLDRVLSVSYVASAPEAVRAEVIREVTELLETDAELRGRERVLMPYATDVFWCVRR
jgi:SAM-dependent methyltransferase